MRRIFQRAFAEIDHPIVDHFNKLSLTERKVAVLTMLGWTSKEIADHFDCTYPNISNHKRRMVQKIHKARREQCQR